MVTYRLITSRWGIWIVFLVFSILCFVFWDLRVANAANEITKGSRHEIIRIEMALIYDRTNFDRPGMCPWGVPASNLFAELSNSTDTPPPLPISNPPFCASHLGFFPCATLQQFWPLNFDFFLFLRSIARLFSSQRYRMKFFMVTRNSSNFFRWSFFRALRFFFDNYKHTICKFNERFYDVGHLFFLVSFEFFLLSTKRIVY